MNKQKRIKCLGMKNMFLKLNSVNGLSSREDIHERRINKVEDESLQMQHRKHKA